MKSNNGNPNLVLSTLIEVKQNIYIFFFLYLVKLKMIKLYYVIYTHHYNLGICFFQYANICLLFEEYYNKQ